MDKVLVLGALGEIGFKMTALLLEEGYEVRGIHLQSGDETVYNNRRMEIGRNANFEEIGLNEWVQQDDLITTSTVVFLNSFDENVKRVWMDENSHVKRKLQAISSNTKSSIVFIHPFTEWEKRNLNEYEENVMCFFVSLPHEVKSSHVGEESERKEFSSIFKAIMDVVGMW
ncbi:hypothetical protein M3175_16835 [Robertmurraya korlensis]|uniref:hypothetical protein n=1 Tax=Robertmurraya korlensis TaxID=519977 RepID=UPI00203E810C|nr:hypothetical protein [Robertmurraya korlensis]MCM3602401.1 hypothetical protein [Robertmurraya korlensis]